MTEAFAVVDEMMAWISRSRESLVARGLTVAVGPPHAGRPARVDVIGDAWMTAVGLRPWHE
jgi:hypothetical protein